MRPFERQCTLTNVDLAHQMHLHRIGHDVAEITHQKPITSAVLTGIFSDPLRCLSVDSDFLNG